MEDKKAALNKEIHDAQSLIELYQKSNPNWSQKAGEPSAKAVAEQAKALREALELVARV